MQAGGSHGGLPERVFYQMITGATDPNLLQAIPNSPDGAAIYSATDGTGAARFGRTGGNIITGSGVSRPIVLTYNVANDKVVKEAFLRQQTLSVVTNIAGTENVGAAAPSSIILASGLQVLLWPTVRITTNDLFVFFSGCPVKPVFQQKRQAVRMVTQNADNSDIARRSKLWGWYWDSREGYGTNLTFGTIKIDN